MEVFLQLFFLCIVKVRNRPWIISIDNSSKESVFSVLPVLIESADPVNTALMSIRLSWSTVFVEHKVAFLLLLKILLVDFSSISSCITLTRKL